MVLKGTPLKTDSLFRFLKMRSTLNNIFFFFYTYIKGGVANLSREGFRRYTSSTSPVPSSGPRVALTPPPAAVAWIINLKPVHVIGNDINRASVSLRLAGRPVNKWPRQGHAGAAGGGGGRFCPRRRRNRTLSAWCGCRTLL